MSLNSRLICCSLHSGWTHICMLFVCCASNSVKPPKTTKPFMTMFGSSDWLRIVVISGKTYHKSRAIVHWSHCHFNPLVCLSYLSRYTHPIYLTVLCTSLVVVLTLPRSRLDYSRTPSSLSRQGYSHLKIVYRTLFPTLELFGIGIHFSVLSQVISRICKYKGNVLFHGRL